MNSENNLKVVPTKAALLQKNIATEFQATVFEEPKRQTNNVNQSIVNRKRLNEVDSEKRSIKDRDCDVEFDIKKARHEVLNFAMSGQQSKNKRKMEIFQAVKLGAKPPKKAYKNYKVLLDEKKRLKTIREQRLKFHQLGKNQVGAASVKCKGRTKSNKRRAPVNQIAKHYGVANPNLKRK